MQRALLLPATIFPAMLVLACWVSFTNPPPIDFVSFWNAAGLVLRGDGGAAYALQPSSFGQLMPIAYPPPFLLLIAPFGLVGFGVAFLAWTVVTGALYLFAAGPARRVALASPPALSNGLVGQNGFLTAGIFLLGLRWLPTRPMIAGLILGLMVIKPQLTLMLPIAFIAGRHWTALLGAALSAAATMTLAAAVFGVGIFSAFLGSGAHYAMLLERGRWPWNELASTYALVRWLGANGGVAMAIHLTVAIVAAALTWLAWRRDWECKVPVAAAASLLVSPYLFTYDAVLLVAPLAWLAARAPGWSVLIWCLSLLPLLRTVGYAGPNGVPLAAALSLLALALLHKRASTSLAWPVRA